MIEIGGKPAIDGVTVIASIAGWDVSDILPLRDRVVVATRAGPGNLQMIDSRCRRERRDCVAIFTNVGARDMCLWFADRIDRVMAAYAVTRDVVVVEVGR